MTDDQEQGRGDERVEDPSAPPADSPAENRPKVVVGLGNPGEKYLRTRHNVGFRVVEELAERHGVDAEEICRSRVFRGTADESEIWWVAPQTYMNRSGLAVRCLAERSGLAAEDFLIVYDEVHLPLGTLRLRTKGSPGGHRGMESIAENLGTDKVARLRLGVGGEEPMDGAELVDFVLGEFTDEEDEAVRQMILRAADACETWCHDGAQKAMQAWNGPPAAARDGSPPRAGS